MAKPAESWELARTSILLTLVVFISATCCLQTAAGELELPEQPVVCHLLEKEITIDEFGHAHVHDTYSLENTWYAKLVHVFFLLPSDAQSISASDYLGFSISTRTIEVDGMLVTYVYPRYQLRPGESCTITLSYVLPLSRFIERADWHGLHVLNFSFPVTTFPIEKLQVLVSLPNGATYLSTSLESPSVKVEGLRSTVSGGLGDVASLQSIPAFTIEYSYVVFWSALYPTMWFGMLAAVASALLYLMRKPKPPTPVPVPAKALRDFIRAYDEKLSLSAKLRSLEEELKRGKIKKGAFLKRSEAIRRRIRILSREISGIRGEVKKVGGRVADAVDRIETSDLRIEVLRGDIERTVAKYRSGAISRASYLALVSDFRGKMEKEATTIKRALMDLRELL